jgi:hypothetical protein|nr:MAG: hypothetical protein J07AB56_08460 [Candidatus Nanosalinarum sp. J07AB56]
MTSNKNDVSIAEATRELLERKPFLNHLMDIGAVNYRGLARHLEDEVLSRTNRAGVNLDSIVMAIRRYEKEISVEDSPEQRIKSVLEESELFMVGDVNYYTLPRKQRFHEIAIEAYKKAEEKTGDRAYILQSDSEIGIILRNRNSELVEEQVSKREMRNLEQNLAMVVVESPEEILEADGMLSYLTERISFEGVGLIDMVTTYTETVFLVREGDATQLYSVLRDLTG